MGSSAETGAALAPILGPPHPAPIRQVQKSTVLPAATGKDAFAMEHSPSPSHPLRWFPEFLELGQRRLRPQARLLGLSLLVGVIAGIGAIVFYGACQLVVHYALDGLAGYRPDHPGG